MLESQSNELQNEALRQFINQNPEIDLRQIDLHNQHHRSALNWDGLDPQQLTPYLKAQQRLLRLHPDGGVRETLSQHGFDSAHRIASIPGHRFVRDYARIFGGDEEKAREVHRKALAIKARVKHLWANIRDFAASQHYRATLFQNADPAMVEYFQNIPSYEELFGGIDYCHCEQCRSIFSPAAYFLDLMRITDQYITEPNTSIPPGYKLEERRPDLFNLQLTCGNTNTAFPYLQIVNRILETHIASQYRVKGTGTITIVAGQTGVAGSGTQFEREMVGDTIECKGELHTVTAVESETELTVQAGWKNAAENADYIITPGSIAFKTLSVAGYPFNLPFNQPLTQVRRYLEELKTRLSIIYRNFLVPQPDLPGVKPIDVAREYLMLSPEQYKVITTPDSSLESLSRYYGFEVAKHLPFAGDGTITFAAGRKIVNGTGTSFVSQISAGDQMQCDGQVKTVTSQGSGVIAFKIGDVSVTGAGTQFSTEISTGDKILCRDEQRTVKSVVSDVSLQVDTAWQANASGADYEILFEQPATRLLVDTAWSAAAADAAYTVLPWESLEHVQTFSYRTGLSRLQLVELFYQGLDAQELAAGIADSFFINRTGEPLPYLQIVHDESDPLFPYSKITGLSLKRLDRLSRFIRLASTMGWSYADLDWCLKSIGVEEITGQVIESLALVKRLQDLTGLAVPALCSLWHNIKTFGRLDALNPQDLFDSIYNNPALLDGQNPYAKNEPPVPFDPTQPLPWYVNNEAEASAQPNGLNDVVRSRLTAALAVGGNDLTEVGNYLISLNGQDNGPLVLDLSNLTRLYRLTILPQTLGLSVDEFFVLLCLMYYPTAPYLRPPAGVLPASPESVAALKEAAEWLRLSPFSVYDLQYILTGVVNGDVNPGYSPDAIPAFIKNLSLISKGSRVAKQAFVFEDIDTEESAQIFNELRARNFISEYGILLNKVADYSSLAFLFPVTETTFITQPQSGLYVSTAQGATQTSITPEESAQAFAGLRANGIVIAGETETRGTLLETFNAATPLDFLFISKGNGQSGIITAYDGASRIATVDPSWQTAPDATSLYRVLKVETTGTAQSMSAASITLAADASPDDGAYDGMQISITGVTDVDESRTVVAYDGATKVAIVDAPWPVVSDGSLEYVVNSVAASGTAQGGSQTTITLALTASDADGAYAGMQVVIVPDTKAESKRAEVRAILLQIRRDIFHTADVLNGLEALQEINVLGGLAEFLGSTADMMGVLLPFAAHVNDVFVYLEEFLTPVPDGYEQAFQPVVTQSSFDLQSSLVPNYINADESLAAFDQLVAAKLIIAEPGATSGTVSPDFSKSTSLDFLFVSDPDAVAMRQQVRIIMLLSLRSQSVYALLPALSRGELLVNRLQLSAFETASILGNPEAFGISDTAKLSLANIQSLSLFQILEFAFDDSEHLLIQYLGMPPDATCPGPQINLLASLTGWNAEQICALIQLFWPTGKGSFPAGYNTVPGVARLKQCFDLSAQTGMDIYFLMKLCGLSEQVNSGSLTGWTLENVSLDTGASPQSGAYTGMQIEIIYADGHAEIRTISFYEGGNFRRAYLDVPLTLLPQVSAAYRITTLSLSDTRWQVINQNWDTYAEIAGSLLDAVKARNDNDDFNQLYKTITDQLNTVERDALLGYTIWLLNQQHESILYPSDLYQYLLIDVEMGDCASASLISEGIAAVQLYMQRCRMNLEPGITKMTLIPDAWWEWMSSYRIWEANRKIFLYPENYLVPSLRKDQTPLFSSLSDQLLQTDITDQTVTTAYANYFDGFDVLANLVIGPSYNCARPVPTVLNYSSAPISPPRPIETLYLLGRTSTQPYTYYYRTYENAYTDNAYLNWTPWVKVGLSINAPFVSPIYVFNRLFIFWTEMETSKSSALSSSSDGSQPESEAQSVIKAIVKYSFLNANGQWAQPQQLAEETIVSAVPYEYSEIKESDYLKSRFVPANLAWRQPYVLRIPRGYTGNGRVICQIGSVDVWGMDTFFTKQLKPGDMIWCGYEARVVRKIERDDWLKVETPWEVYRKFSDYRIIPASPADTGTITFRGTGTVAIKFNSPIISGIGTLFLREVAPGNQLKITIGNVAQYVYVVSVNSQTELIIDRVLVFGNVTAPYYITQRPDITEQLLVIYGSDIDTSLEPTQPAAPDITPNDGDDPFIRYRNVFNEALYRSLLLSAYGRGNMKTMSGYVATRAGIFMEENLSQEAAHLIIPNYDFGAENNPRPFTSALDRNSGIFKIVESANVIYDNYWGNSVPAAGSNPAAAPAGLDLLYNISGRSASVFNVSNQPGSYVVNNGDESFLVFTRNLSIGKISEMLLPRPYPFYTTVTIRKGKPLTDLIMLDQQFNNIRLACGAYTTSSFVFKELKFGFTRLSTHTIAALSRKLLAGGLDSLLTIESQETPELDFSRFYGVSGTPPPNLDTQQMPPGRLDFNGSFGAYFWEVFFHAPWLIAAQLNANQQFDMAKRWYEYIFNPTQQPEEYLAHPNDRFWRFLPLRNLTSESLTETLTNPAQIAVYNNKPFEPYSIANLRPTAYQKAIVMRYIDNLLDWGDMLFAQDTRESLTAATNLYVMAAELLGPRPVSVGECPAQEAATFTQIRAEYASEGEPIPVFLIQLENTPQVVSEGEAVPYSDVPFNDINSYFCVPENEEFVAYWARVEDRLFKIRHCMNIQGVERQLALFAPPINPRALIESAAAGGGVTAGQQVETPLPNYRFTFMVEAAKAVAGQLTQLGASLLSAIEKQDAEQLSLIRTTQERAILNLTTQIKQDQIQQVADTQTSLTESRNSAQYRAGYYQSLLLKGLSSGELSSIGAMQQALFFNVMASALRTLSSIGYAMPNVGSPFAMTYGGIQVGNMLSAASGIYEIMSYVASYMAENSLTMSNYQRRAQDWQFQQKLAEYDLNSAAAQMAANEVQMKIAERELEIHYKTIEQNEEMEVYLTKKFTNQELYAWMVSRLSVIYFQTYSLAYDLARAAQRTYQYEMNTDQTFVNFGYWDNLRKGLMAGEGLMLALNQMNKAYIDGNVRALEIERVVSLLQLNPKALLDLKTKGECVFELTEKFFDYDYPGHYCRKIKTISLSLPAIVGPYQSVKATLTQLSNQIVLRPDPGAVNYLLGGDLTTAPGPAVLRSNWQINQRVAISRGIDDTGLFALNFNDERYLPFEGTGAVSTWRISMPLATNQFNFETISDVIIRLSYTAFDAGTAFRQSVIKLPAMQPLPWSQFYSLSQNFSQQWFDFITNHQNPTTQTMTFTLANLVPPHVKPNAKLLGFYLALDLSPEVSAQSASTYIKFQVTDNTLVGVNPGPQNAEMQILKSKPNAAKVSGERKIIFDLQAAPPTLKKDGFLNPAVLQNIILILYFEGEADWSI